MEQATNLFSKGLLSDSHPMILGNDTLTDCLNGTLVTMNGNELVLQNDMGNRRIDHANLPEGYEPVGIKEYGGIIYIACYNPITNRGLIGSFPSPERRKGTEYPGLETSINLNGFIGEVNIEEEDYRYKKIKKNTLLFPLTEEITLHAGDLFKLSFVDSVLDIIHYIVKQGVRNPLFTLKIGILNSLNEFVDITEDLKLYKIGGSDEHPINYFISLPGLDQQELSYTTIDDETFIKNRLADLSVNTYSYKIVSPLYLQATINTFTRTDVSCYAEVTNKNNDKYTCDFELTVNYEHDCPFNDSYKPIIIVNGSSVRNQDITIKTLGEEEYISKFGDLKSKVVYTFSVNNLPRETNLKVKFPLIHDYFYEEDSIIVDTLEFDLDLEKVGSDTIEFNGYKYYNYDNYTNLKLDLTTYPKRKNSKLKNLYIKLYDWLNERDPIMGRGLLYEGDIPSGVTEFTFEWPEEWKRRYLKIEIDYGTDIKPLIPEKLMFITTELFNDNYNGTEEFDVGENNKYIENGNYKYNYLVHRYALIDDYRKIKKIILTPTVDITSKFNDISSNYDSSYESNLSKGNITENTLNDWQLRFWTTIYNKELFPENIYVSHCSNNENYFDGEKEECEVYVNDILFALKKGDSNFIVTLEGLNILDELKNGSNSEKDVINFEFIRDAESQGEFLFTLKEIVNNFWESSVSDREICVQNTITSFYKFLEESSACYIEMPVICIDCRGRRKNDLHFWIMNTFDRNSHVGSDSNSHVLLKFENYKGNQSLINSYILGITNNMFVGEWNDNDYIIPKENASIVIKNDDSQQHIHLKGYKRVWMKYEQNKYLPIYIGTLESGGNPEHNDFSQCYEYIKAGLRIPHLYVYNPTPQYFQSEIADFNESSYNLEFKYDVKLVLKEIFDETHGLCVDFNSIFKLENNYSGLFILNDKLQPVTITLNQSNIKSSDDFVDLRESLKSGQINCAYVYGNKIEIIDDKGNLLDPKYVYKQIGNQDTGSKITKSYIPLHKFSINNYLVPYLLARSDKYEEGTFIQFERPMYYSTYKLINESKTYYAEGKTKLTFDIPDIYNIPPYNNENNGE